MVYKKEKVKEFWDKHGMTYDWDKKYNIQEGSRIWFKRIDKILFDIEKFLRDKKKRPFGAIIPYDELKGKKVLEVGCGMGSITGFMAKRGYNYYIY